MLQSIEPSDEALAARVASGDIAAFGALYDRYSRRVYAWAVHALGPAEADDLLQETFLRLWDKAEQFDTTRGRFGWWFGAIARHAIIARSRKRSRERRLVAADEIEKLLTSIPDPTPGTDEQAWIAERSSELGAAVRELPAEQRRVIVLAYFAGLTQTEIAAATATPVGTVKKRTRLALAKLRRSVAEYGSAPAVGTR